SYGYSEAGNRTSKSAGGVTEYLGYDHQNKLLWTNQAANARLSSGQAAPYRLYQYNANGEPTRIERRQATGGALTSEWLGWDSPGKLRQGGPGRGGHPPEHTPH